MKKNCNQCGKAYDPREIVRIHGDFSSVHLGGFCSAACYTINATIGKPV